MLNDATCFKNVYIVTGYTDLRSGIDRLASLVKSKKDEPPKIKIFLFTKEFINLLFLTMSKNKCYDSTDN